MRGADESWYAASDVLGHRMRRRKQRVTVLSEGDTRYTRCMSCGLETFAAVDGSRPSARRGRDSVDEHYQVRSCVWSDAHVPDENQQAGRLHQAGYQAIGTMLDSWVSKLTLTAAVPRPAAVSAVVDSAQRLSSELLVLPGGSSMFCGASPSREPPRSAVWAEH